MIDVSMANKASLISRSAHGAIGQVRKYTGEPYYEHCRNVANIVGRVNHDTHMICAAFLHDVAEDTKLPINFIEVEFNKDVARLVSELTDISKPEDGNRKIRKAIDREHTKNASVEAKTIKLADLIDNSSTILKHDQAFAEIYLKEKRLLLDEALKEGNPILWRLADLIASEKLILTHSEIIKRICDWS